MKNYIFITFSIINAGGSQLYVRNKSEYLQKNGYNVYVFSATEGSVLINGLKKYKPYIIHDLAYSPLVLSNMIINNVLNRISESVCFDKTETIVETHSIQFGLWGELLAEKIHAKHFLYSLEESNSLPDISFLEFTTYKWRQIAFAGIIKRSLITFFNKYGVTISDNQAYWLPAYCNNPVEDIPSNIDLVSDNINICLMGRLNKGFMRPSAQAIADYIKTYTSTSYNVVIIGGGEESIEKDFVNIFKDLSNANLILTGFLSPISYDLISKMDVVVTSSGCCTAAWRQGLVVISIDGKDYNPIGVFKYTTENSLFRTDEPMVPLQHLLDDVLVKRKYPKKVQGFVPVTFDFKDHIDFINNMKNSYSYYKVLDISISYKLKVIENVKRFLYNLLGAAKYSKIAVFFKTYLK